MSLNDKELPEENKINMWVNNISAMDPLYIFNNARMQQYWHWCSQFCSGEFDCTIPDRTGKLTWLFAKASDATMFRLKWHGNKN